MFMTRDERVEMTGARRSSSICQWLKDQKLPFRLGRDNWPQKHVKPCVAFLASLVE